MIALPCIAHMNLADQLTALVDIDTSFVAKIAFAVFFCPPRIRVFLSSFALLPILWHIALFNARVFLLSIALYGRWHDGGINHLPAA